MARPFPVNPEPPHPGVRIDGQFGPSTPLQPPDALFPLSDSGVPLPPAPREPFTSFPVTERKQRIVPRGVIIFGG